MGWIAVFLAFLGSLSLVLALPALSINEVMYNPAGNDNDREFVEISYPPGFLNLSGYIVGDAKSNDTLMGVSYSSSLYSLIVEEGFNATGLNASIYSVGPTIGNNLNNNDPELVRLYYPNGTLIDTMNYNNSLGGNDNGRSLEKRADGQWAESIVDGGTPGQENSNLRFSDDFTALQISEIYPNTFEDDTAEKPEGEWVELYNSGNAFLDVNGLVLRDQDDENELFIADDKVLDGTIISPQGYLVIYRDGDSNFGLNNNGYEEVRLFEGDTLLDNISYSNTLEGMSLSRIGDAFFTTIPTPGEANYLEQSCDWFLDAYLSDVVIYNDTFELQFEVGRSYGFPQNLTVRGDFQDLGGNVVQTYTPWNGDYVASGGIKEYTPRLGRGTYKYSFSIENLSCEDDYPGDNHVEGLVVVKAPPGQNTSSVAIEQLYMGNDESVEWGDQFTARISIYKADESRYSVQLWAEKDGEKISPITKVNVYDTFVTYPLTLPIQLDANCDEDLDDGTATLVLEAFGLHAEKKFPIEGIDDEICKEYRATAPKKSTASNSSTVIDDRYQLLELPASIAPGEALRLTVQILNDEQPHTYTLYGYLYRGNKCYSCFGSAVERDHASQTVALKSGEAKIISLLLKADETMDEGEYKVKVKIRKDVQKTEQELTNSIYVQLPAAVSQAESSLSTAAEGDDLSGAVPAAQRQHLGTGVMVYQSNSAKSQMLLPLILAGTFGLLSLILVMRQFRLCPKS